MNQQGDGQSTERQRIIILGASARALAHSASAAGWEVHAADLFGDVDLRAVAPAAIRVASRDEYPGNLAVAAAAMPAGPWCYTGAIENHPDLIDAIGMARPLAGTPAAAVRMVRDPARLAASLRAAGLRFPETVTAPMGVPEDGTFLLKPRAGAAGRGIRPWVRPMAGGESRPEQWVWQRRIAGAPHAAAFIVAHDGPRLIGLSRQLIGEPWCHAGAFAYCGSVVVPKASIPNGVAAQLARIGSVLAAEHDLVGAVGVDVVIDAAGDVWVIEVNPRFTASMELHERSTGESVAALHLHACGFAMNVATPPRRPRACRVWAKAVLHAPLSIGITDPLVATWQRSAAAWGRDEGGLPALADIPAPGQTIPRGAPLLTVFAAGVDAAAAMASLTARVDATLATC